MTTSIYKYIDAGTIQFFRTNVDGSITNGPIVDGDTRTRQVQTGTQEMESGSAQVENGSEQVENGSISVEVGVDEEGNPIFEDQMQYMTIPTYETVITYTTEPVFETVTYSPWDELMASDAQVQPVPQEVIDAEAIEAFKESRRKKVRESTVITSQGNEYDADETSIARMGFALLAMDGEPEDLELSWSLANTGSGVMSLVILSDLKEAQKEAVKKMAALWAAG